MLKASCAALALLSTLASANDEPIRRMLVERVDVGKEGTGIVVGIVGPDGRRVIAHGTLGANDPRPMNGDTVFPIASVSKVFTSLLLADMVQRGEVALDDPVAKFLRSDRVTVPQRGGRQITLIDLATNTSGLPPYFPGYGSRGLFSSDWMVDSGYRFLTNHSLAHDIGTRYEYGNFGVVLLGHALALKAGTSYEELVRDRIGTPLGMKDTAIALSADMAARLAPGHDAQLAPAPMNKMLEHRRPGGFPPSTHTALGWMVVPTTTGEVAWHAGRASGYRTFAGIDRSKGVGVVVLSNGDTETGVTDLGLHLLDAQFPLRRQVAEISVDAERLDRYVGRYDYSPAFSYTITREDKRLFIQATGYLKNEMFAKSEHEFFLKAMHAQVVFEAGEAGAARALVFQNLRSGVDSRAVRSPP